MEWEILLFLLGRNSVHPHATVGSEFLGVKSWVPFFLCGLFSWQLWITSQWQASDAALITIRWSVMRAHLLFHSYYGLWYQSCMQLWLTLDCTVHWRKSVRGWLVDLLQLSFCWICIGGGIVCDNFPHIKKLTEGESDDAKPEQPFWRKCNTFGGLVIVQEILGFWYLIKPIEFCLTYSIEIYYIVTCLMTAMRIIS